jgi:hypothetical protein
LKGNVQSSAFHLDSGPLNTTEVCGDTSVNYVRELVLNGTIGGDFDSLTAQAVI